MPFSLEKVIVGMLAFGQLKARTKATIRKMLEPTDQPRFTEKSFCI